MDVTHFLNTLRGSRDYAGQIVHVEDIPPRSAAFADLDAPMDERLRDAIRRAGVHRFYSHQAASINAARAGQNVVTVTSTASGKTVCYSVPVLDDLLRHPNHRALFLFPTKALAQDQMAKLNGLHLPGLVAATFDGDTPREDRAAIKRTAGILLTNPDMLSVGILPYHASWAAFLRNLRFIVIDEVHAYRGVFGSHVANVMRRLRRVCARYGARPQFLCSSATIANPEELVRHLTGASATLIDSDGSPSGAKRFVFWNPPQIGSGDAGRKSTNIETTNLFATLVQEGIRTIAFARARQTAEIILRYTRNALQISGSDLGGRITSYRAGYRPEERREIERRLFNGDLLGVVSTSALELGVDIGGLDACILNGFPGTVASTWQQAGRAGRGAHESIAVLVAHDNPLDQFLMSHPEYFFGRSHEHAIVDPDNLHILRPHVRAAAYELPLADSDAKYFGIGLAMVLKELEEEGQIRGVGANPHPRLLSAGESGAGKANPGPPVPPVAPSPVRNGPWVYCGGTYPAGDINIRSASGDQFNILDIPSRRVLGTVDIENVFLTIHPGAVYLHQGEAYLVEELDIDNKCARVAGSDVNYYTQPRESNAVDIVSEQSHRRAGRTQSHFGTVTVTSHVTGFRRKQLFTDSVLDVEDLDLPPLTFDTEALWFVIPSWAVQELETHRVDIAGGLHAIEHATIGLMPLYAMCDRNDIGGVSYPQHPELGVPACFIYDAHPGGVGIAERSYDMLESLLTATRDCIALCACMDGCPSCIQSPKCGNNNEPLSKDGALRILNVMLGETR